VIVQIQLFFSNAVITLPLNFLTCLTVQQVIALSLWSLSYGRDGREIVAEVRFILIPKCPDLHCDRPSFHNSGCLENKAAGAWSNPLTPHRVTYLTACRRTNFPEQLTYACRQKLPCSAVVCCIFKFRIHTFIHVDGIFFFSHVTLNGKAKFENSINIKGT